MFFVLVFLCYGISERFLQGCNVFFMCFLLIKFSGASSRSSVFHRVTSHCFFPLISFRCLVPSRLLHFFFFLIFGTRARCHLAALGFITQHSALSSPYLVQARYNWRRIASLGVISLSLLVLSCSIRCDSATFAQSQYMSPPSVRSSISLGFAPIKYWRFYSHDGSTSLHWVLIR